ncbi:MAG: hypothetical protein DWI57_03555 [Chloroflexi bacterium]|nr:MAG: hypothetical protein DWI57_03555 [Chloroflexota bacterium]
MAAGESAARQLYDSDRAIRPGQRYPPGLHPVPPNSRTVHSRRAGHPVCCAGIKGNGDWGLGIGDWGLGIGDWDAWSPVSSPQSPFPNPQSPSYGLRHL